MIAKDPKTIIGEVLKEQFITSTPYKHNTENASKSMPYDEKIVEESEVFPVYSSEDEMLFDADAALLTPEKTKMPIVLTQDAALLTPEKTKTPIVLTQDAALLTPEKTKTPIVLTQDAALLTPEKTKTPIILTQNAALLTPVKTKMPIILTHTLSDKDLNTLDGCNCLNDEVLNFSLQLKVRENSQDIFGTSNINSFFVLESFLMLSLLKRNFCIVVQLLYKKKVLNFDSILISMNTDLEGPGFHWVLIHIHLNLKEIRVYNSLRSISLPIKCKESLKNFLAILHAVAGVPVSLKDYTYLNVTDTPQQLPGSNDCGVSVIQNAFSILDGRHLSSGSELRTARNNLKTSLQSQVLIQERQSNKTNLPPQDADNAIKLA